MNKSGVFQGSLLQQQMVGGSPSWWSMNHLRPNNGETSPLLHPHALQQHLQPSNSLSLNSLYESQELPQSWSQLLLGGLVGEEERYGLGTPFKKTLNWEEQLMHQSQGAYTVDVKQENSESLYSHGSTSEEIQLATASRASWSQILPVSSPRSCVTSSLSSNMLDFSNSKAERKHLPPDHSSECNSIETGAVSKKARVHGSSSSQSTTFKVRKEKLGDRITALHQLVSPFGKTDTASVLLEAIGYIRFLQSQIEALSSPYLNIASRKTRLPAQGERSCIFPEDPGQVFFSTLNLKFFSSTDAMHQKEWRGKKNCPGVSRWFEPRVPQYFFVDLSGQIGTIIRERILHPDSGRNIPEYSENLPLSKWVPL